MMTRCSGGGVADIEESLLAGQSQSQSYIPDNLSRCPTPRMHNVHYNPQRTNGISTMLWLLLWMHAQAVIKSSHSVAVRKCEFG